MKLMHTCILSAASVLMALPASAGGVKEGFTLSPLVGGYSFDGKQHLETMPIGGLRLGYNFTKYVGAEAGIDGGRTEGTKGLPKTNVFRYGADLLFHLFPDSTVVPYLAAGYGAITFDSGDTTNKGIFDYGPGIKVFLNDQWALRGDFRHLVFKNNDESQYNYQYMMGLCYQFGAPAPAVKAEPKPEPPPAPKPVEAAKPLAAPAAPVLDSDGDGVPDNLDKCPNTPQGVKVDKNGCPIDSDGDGVPDYLDKCPNTPKGVKVDKDGCPLDSDGDGVPDYLDKCPDTPKGAPVDKVGCPLDSDGDGVPDYLDKCPDTPKGKKVDSDGCPIPEKVSLSLEVEFDTGKSDIKSRYHEELKKVGDFMNKYPEANGVIEGHTDNVGSASANQKLSQRRADAVRTYIIKKFGIAPSRLTARGYGEDKPIASNSTAAGRQKNRRIIATIDTVVK